MPQPVCPARSTWCAIPTRASPAPSRTATSCATTRTSLIEGMAIAALRDGLQARLQLHPRRDLGCLRALRGGARARRTPRAFIGEDILGSGFSLPPVQPPRLRRVHLRRGNRAARVARGQEGAAALQAAVPGELRPVRQADRRSTTPRPSPPCRGSSTTAATRFLALGRPNNGGTKIFSVTGDVARPGNYEVRLGTPFAKLLEMAGGMRARAQAQGGASPAARRCRCCPARIMMTTDMDYDSIAKAGSMLGSGARDRHGRDHAAWCKSLLRACRTSTSRSPAASARRAARAPAGSAAWSTASSTAREERGSRPAAVSVADNIAGTHDLRAGRRRRAAGEELHPAFPRRIPVPHRPQAAAWCTEPGYSTLPTLARCQAALTMPKLDNRRQERPRSATAATVMEAAQRLDIYVPHFCYHKKLSIAANCRMCLVQVEKAPKPQPACATPATEGMKVWTHSRLREAGAERRDGIPARSTIRSTARSATRAASASCRISRSATAASRSRFTEEPKRVVLNKNLGPLISTDMTRCIHCTRCVRFGQEIAGVMELGMIGRGEHAEIIAFVGKHRRLRAVRQHDRPVPGRRADLEAVPLHGAHLGARAAQVGQSPHDSARAATSSCR